MRKRANPLMLHVTCVNTPIYYSVFHNLHAHVARCSASCVNGALHSTGNWDWNPTIDFICFEERERERKLALLSHSSVTVEKNLADGQHRNLEVFLGRDGLIW